MRSSPPRKTNSSAAVGWWSSTRPGCKTCSPRPACGYSGCTTGTARGRCSGCSSSSRTPLFPRDGLVEVEDDAGDRGPGGAFDHVTVAGPGDGGGVEFLADEALLLRLVKFHEQGHLVRARRAGDTAAKQLRGPRLDGRRLPRQRAPQGLRRLDENGVVQQRQRLQPGVGHLAPGDPRPA